MTSLSHKQAACDQDAIQALHDAEWQSLANRAHAERHLAGLPAERRAELEADWTPWVDPVEHARQHYAAQADRLNELWEKEL